MLVAYGYKQQIINEFKNIDNYINLLLFFSRSLISFWKDLSLSFLALKFQKSFPLTFLLNVTARSL